ncbi:MAG: HAMP domain-containing protein [Polyangiaceae bacterium]|nr:HAMP domain-containing protein [Polyangiaceae bacterium]
MNTASTPPKQPTAYRRSVRNYLLDSRLQLKYTGFLVGVAVVICTITGAVLFATTRSVVNESSALVEESRKVSEVSRMNVRDLAPGSPDLVLEFNREADAHDRIIAEQQAALIQRQARMLASLVGGLVLMVVLIGALGIYFTHKIAGPVHKMKRLLKQVGEGDLHVEARLRRGDELQDFFDVFTQMVENLRTCGVRNLIEVERAVAALDQGSADGAREAMVRVRDALKKTLRV